MASGDASIIGRVSARSDGFKATQPSGRFGAHSASECGERDAQQKNANNVGCSARLHFVEWRGRRHGVGPPRVWVAGAEDGYAIAPELRSRRRAERRRRSRSRSRLVDFRRPFRLRERRIRDRILTRTAGPAYVGPACHTFTRSPAFARLCARPTRKAHARTRPVRRARPGQSARNSEDEPSPGSFAMWRNATKRRSSRRRRKKFGAGEKRAGGETPEGRRRRG